MFVGSVYFDRIVMDFIIGYIYFIVVVSELYESYVGIFYFQKLVYKKLIIQFGMFCVIVVYFFVGYVKFVFLGVLIW